ncbi:MAG: methylaspartate mutase subunit E [Exilispira sp.]|jgi:methylaspartate mutase epsilon subunit|nr:methylaspartate mutase subunit E [Exilispira sp.]
MVFKRELKNKKIDIELFFEERKEVLNCWYTGKILEDIREGVEYQKSIPESKRFSTLLRDADQKKQTLVQPRAGVALIEEHIELLRYLEQEADLLPTTIDAYTRQNKYIEAEKGIQRSKEAGRSLLNGFPAVNWGVENCRKVIESLKKPVQVRHGTPDARLLAEITLAAGFTSFEGGGISYNIPYAKSVALEKSLKDWQYINRLIGYYEENGARVNLEPFGPLTGTLVPPFISNTIAIIEGLLALEQGVKSITLGYGQLGNLVQDAAAIISLKEIANEIFNKFGYKDYELTTVFHQWMGGFPEDEARAFGVISSGAVAAALAKATKVIVKTPHEALGIPTKEANLQGLKATKQVVNMFYEQTMDRSENLEKEIKIIKNEVRYLLERVIEAGNGDLAIGVVKSFEAGILDVPFAPSIYNKGKIMPARDNNGAVRVLDAGFVPISKEMLEFHKEKIQERADFENREPGFQMLVDDIYAISKGRLVGRPRKI